MIRLIIPVVSVALCVASIQLAAENRQLYPMLAVGSTLERGQPLEVTALYSADLDDSINLSLRACRSLPLRAAVTIILARLDAANQLIDYERWLTAVRRAQFVFDGALRCMPTDGNIWLRKAMVTKTIAEVPELVASLLSKSLLYAPAEENIVEARIALLNAVNRQTLSLATSIADHDLAVLLQHGSKTLLRRALAGLSSSLQSLLNSQISSLSPARQKQLLALLGS